MTLVVSTGALLLLHQLSVSVVVAGTTELQVLLLYGVSWYLLDGQPVQRLLSTGIEKKDKFKVMPSLNNLVFSQYYVVFSSVKK